MQRVKMGPISIKQIGRVNKNNHNKYNKLINDSIFSVNK